VVAILLSLGASAVTILILTSLDTSFKSVDATLCSISENVTTSLKTAVYSVPLTDARHSALLKHRVQIGQQPTQLASTQLPSTDSPGINWGVAAIGAALGMFGLMLLFAVVVYTGRHNRRGGLAAT
jgi:hypothetical protein